MGIHRPCIGTFVSLRQADAVVTGSVEDPPVLQDWRGDWCRALKGVVGEVTFVLEDVAEV